MFTISQLIEKLQEYEPDQLVMVDGYEGGFVHITPDQLITKEVELFTNKQPWDGPHDISEHDSNSSQEVLIISRHLHKKNKYS
jgi:hypothetical protein